MGKKNYTTDWVVWELIGSGYEYNCKYVRVATFHADYFYAKHLAMTYINNHAEQHINYYKVLPVGVKPREIAKQEMEIGCELDRILPLESIDDELRKENADLKARLESAEQRILDLAGRLGEVQSELDCTKEREAKPREALEKRCKECEIDYDIDRNKDEGCPNCWIKAALDEQPGEKEVKT